MRYSHVYAKTKSPSLSIEDRLAEEEQLNIDLQDELKEAIANIHTRVSDRQIRYNKKWRFNRKYDAFEKILETCMGIQLNVDDDDLMYDIIHICCHHINDKNKLIYSNSIFEWFCRMDIEPVKQTLLRG